MGCAPVWWEYLIKRLILLFFPSTVHQIFYCWLFAQLRGGGVSDREGKEFIRSYCCESFSFSPFPCYRSFSSLLSLIRHPHLKSHHTFKFEESCAPCECVKKRQWIYIRSGSCRRDSFSLSRREGRTKICTFSVMFPYSHSFVVEKRKPETRKNLHLKAPSSFGATVRRAPCIAQKGWKHTSYKGCLNKHHWAVI